MAEFRGEDFKFPDEIEAENKGKHLETGENDDFEIEVVDDTPERDRGRKPLDREVLDPTDEEINQYTKGAQERIKELTHARHDERRAKEAALRERQELDRLTQQLADENKRLKEYVNVGTEQYSQMARSAADARLEKARRDYKVAQEAFDTDAIVAAQEALTEAKMQVEAAKNFRPTPLQTERNDVYSQPQQVQEPYRDEKLLRWQAKNQWWGQPGFEEITSYALGLHQKLVNSGVDPRSDQYYETIDSRIKKTFPDVFGEATDRSSSDSPRKTPSVAAPATRSSGTKKVQLTSTQMALAKKYKLDPKVYYAEVVKLEKQNGR
jgi:hypothetical protein